MRAGSLGDEIRRVQMLVQFWVNHHLLSLLERPLWRVVSGRSRTYVNAVLAAMPGRVRVNTEVIGIDRESAKVRLTVKQVETEAVRDLGFDHVVLACHSDQSLAILVRVSTKPIGRRSFARFDLPSATIRFAIGLRASAPLPANPFCAGNGG